MESDNYMKKPMEGKSSRLLQNIERGVAYTCNSIGYLHRIFGLKIFGQNRQNRTWLLDLASDGGRTRRSVPRA
jgi:hypothetical protein